LLLLPLDPGLPQSVSKNNFAGLPGWRDVISP